TVGGVAGRKRTAPVLGGSLNDKCFRFCCCKRSAVSVAITEATSGARSQLPNAIRPIVNSPRVNRQAIRNPMAALHRACAPAILTQCKLAKRRRLARCGRLSSAVAVLGFEYGLPRAKR